MSESSTGAGDRDAVGRPAGAADESSELAGSSVVKRVLPPVAGLAALAIAVSWWMRRRRR